jgi:hypothetical protein
MVKQCQVGVVGGAINISLEDAALKGGKVIPVLGNALSATIGLYDGYQLA